MQSLKKKNNRRSQIKERKDVFPAGLEPAAFRVLGGRDNHYTTETSPLHRCILNYVNVAMIKF